MSIESNRSRMELTGFSEGGGKGILLINEIIEYKKDTGIFVHYYQQENLYYAFYKFDKTGMGNPLDLELFGNKDWREGNPHYAFGITVGATVAAGVGYFDNKDDAFLSLKGQSYDLSLWGMGLSTNKERLTQYQNQEWYKGRWFMMNSSVNGCSVGLGLTDVQPIGKESTLIHTITEHYEFRK